MRNLRLLFFVGLAAGFISEKLLVSSIADDLYLEGQVSGDFPIDDDDREDQGSGSGSGDYDDMFRRISNFSRTTVSKEMVPSQPQPTADSQDPSTTVKDTETTPFRFPGGDKEDEESTGHLSTSMPPSETTATKFSKDITVSKDTDEGNGLDRWDVSVTKGGGDEGQIKEVENEILAKDGRGSRMYDMESPKEVTSENLWERTEVLAAVIACGVVGFLCAVFLLLLVVYRMKKKDEGSYDLGDTKLSSTIYHKAPTKEFYA